MLGSIEITCKDCGITMTEDNKNSGCNFWGGREGHTWYEIEEKKDQDYDYQSGICPDCEGDLEYIQEGLNATVTQMIMGNTWKQTNVDFDGSPSRTYYHCTSCNNDFCDSDDNETED